MNDALIASAIRLFHDGKFAEAAQVCTEILHTNPRQFDALYLLGFLHLQHGRFAEAERLIAEALTVDLAPGEMLFIPRGWWHHFQTLERSVALNFFWATPALLPPLVISKLLWMLRRVQT